MTLNDLVKHARSVCNSWASWFVRRI